MRAMLHIKFNLSLVTGRGVLVTVSMMLARETLVFEAVGALCSDV